MGGGCTCQRYEELQGGGLKNVQTSVTYYNAWPLTLKHHGAGTLELMLDDERKYNQNIRI